MQIQKQEMNGDCLIIVCNPGWSIQLASMTSICQYGQYNSICQYFPVNGGIHHQSIPLAWKKTQIYQHFANLNNAPFKLSGFNRVQTDKYEKNSRTFQGFLKTILQFSKTKVHENPDLNVTILPQKC